MAGVEPHPTLQIEHIAGRGVIQGVAACGFAFILLIEDLEVLGQIGQLLRGGAQGQKAGSKLPI